MSKMYPLSWQNDKRFDYPEQAMRDMGSMGRGRSSLITHRSSLTTSAVAHLSPLTASYLNLYWQSELLCMVWRLFPIAERLQAQMFVMVSNR